MEILFGAIFLFAVIVTWTNRQISNEKDWYKTKLIEMMKRQHGIRDTAYAERVIDRERQTSKG